MSINYNVVNLLTVKTNIMRKITFLLFFTLNFLTAQQTYEFTWANDGSDANQQIAIEVGDTVTWLWGTGTHNLVSTNGTETFDSGYFTGTGNQFSYTFENVGSTDYVCDPHDNNMYGTVTVSSSTMSISQNNNLNVRIFPNPVTSNFITIKTATIGIKNIKLYDINSRVVLNTSIDSEILNIDNVSPGVYFIQVTVNGQSKISKLIVR